MGDCALVAFFEIDGYIISFQSIVYDLVVGRERDVDSKVAIFNGVAGYDIILGLVEPYTLSCS